MVINEEPITAPGFESDREIPTRITLDEFRRDYEMDYSDTERLEREAEEGRKLIVERREQAKAFLGRLWDAIGDKGEIHPNNDAPEGVYEFSFYKGPKTGAFILPEPVVFTLWFDSEWKYRICSDSGNSMQGGGGETLREWMNPASVDRFAEMLLQLASSDAM